MSNLPIGYYTRVSQCISFIYGHSGKSICQDSGHALKNYIMSADFLCAVWRWIIVSKSGHRGCDTVQCNSEIPD